MFDSLEEIGDFTGIGPTGLNVSLLPVDVGNPIADIIADHIILLDLRLSQMGIVDADKDNATIGRWLNDHSEVESSTSVWSSIPPPGRVLSLSV